MHINTHVERVEQEPEETESGRGCRTGLYPTPPPNQAEDSAPPPLPPGQEESEREHEIKKWDVVDL